MYVWRGVCAVWCLCVCVCAVCVVGVGWQGVGGVRCSKSQEPGLQESILCAGNIPGKQGARTFWSLTFAYRLHRW